MEGFNASSHISVKIGLLIVVLHYWLTQGLDFGETATLVIQTVAAAAMFAFVFRGGESGVIGARRAGFWAIHTAAASVTPYLLRPFGHQIFERVI